MRLHALAAGSLLLGIAPALAAPQIERGNKDLKTYCSGDAVTFCGGIDPNSPAMDACFQKHRGDLSENCRRAIDAYTAGGGK